MVRKKMEGDEEQRRAAARAAREAGRSPSAGQVTTGASKQRGHLTHRDSIGHEERLEARHKGKQRRPAEEAGHGSRPPEQPPVSFRGRGRPAYSPEHETVFAALVEAVGAHGGEAVHLDDIARSAHRPRDQVRPLVHDLVVAHRVVTELAGADEPDLGPRYELRPGR